MKKYRPGDVEPTWGAAGTSTGCGRRRHSGRRRSRLGRGGRRRSGWGCSGRRRSGWGRRTGETPQTGDDDPENSGNAGDDGAQGGLFRTGIGANRLLIRPFQKLPDVKTFQELLDAVYARRRRFVLYYCGKRTTRTLSATTLRLELGVRLLCTAGERGGHQHAQDHWSGQFRNTPSHSVSNYSRFCFREHKQFLAWERLFFEGVAAAQHRGFLGAAQYLRPR